MTDIEARKARYAAALGSANLDAILRVADDELAELRAENERLRLVLKSPEMQLRGHLAFENRVQTERAEAAEAKIAAAREALLQGGQTVDIRWRDALLALDAPTVGRDETGAGR